MPKGSAQRRSKVWRGPQTQKGVFFIYSVLLLFFNYFFNFLLLLIFCFSFSYCLFRAVVGVYGCHVREGKKKTEREKERRKKTEKKERGGKVKKKKKQKTKREPYFCYFISFLKTQKFSKPSSSSTRRFRTRNLRTSHPKKLKRRYYFFKFSRLFTLIVKGLIVLCNAIP